ncbi:MAG: MmcQ/YjbR family DNA-binding protein [Sphingobacteriaceae bacterium]
MDIESIRMYCLEKPGVTEGLPFGDSVLVFKVSGKMFLLLDLTGGETINVKCDPEKAQELRADFEEVQPGYHMNKTHWNTVFLKGRLTVQQIKAMIDDSYELIVASLPKTQQALLKSS